MNQRAVIYARTSTVDQHTQNQVYDLEQLAQQHHKRSFSRPSCRKISHADHAALQSSRAQRSPVIKRIPRPDHAAVDG